MPGFACFIAEDDKSVNQKHLCTSCRMILKDPVQTNCGHRYCKSCVEELLGSPSCHCLIDNEEIKREQIFEDKFARREILSLPVQCANHCDGCDWRGELKQLEDHEAQCPFTKVQCMHPSCGVLIPRNDLPRHLTEDCSFRELQCELCGLVTTADKLKQHQDNDCQEYTVDCPKCLTIKLARKQLPRHLDPVEGDCEAVEVPCPFHNIGCPDGKPRKRRENGDHQDKQASQHLNLLFSFVQQLSNFVYTNLDSVNVFKGNPEFLQNVDRTIQSLLHKVEAMLKEHSNLASVVQGHGTRIGNLERSIERFLMDDLVPDSAPLNSMHRLSDADINRVLRRLDDHDAKVANHEVLLVEVNTLVQGQNQEMKRLELQLREANDEIRKLQRRMESLEHTLSLRNIVTADLEEYVRQKEFSSYDGVLIWKITDFARRRNEAISGRKVSIYSPCFYTSRHGYKMCVRIYLNGDGIGKGTHISLFFVVMRGEYDALLRWPFRQKVTFMLLDQNNVEHVIDAFRPDRSSSSFQRPKRESNIASGCPTFCPLSELRNHAYVQDDSMFIKVIVDTADT